MGETTLVTKTVMVPDYEAENKSVRLEIYRDEDPNGENPREWCNASKMICWHKRYKLGDKHDYSSPEEFEAAFNPKDENYAGEAMGVRLPLFLYDHGGITMSTSHSPPYNDRWDAGQVGYIYMTQKQLLDEFKGDIDRATDYLIGEVETYDQWLTGDVWGFKLIDKKSGEDIANVWGFFGDDFKTDGMTDHVPKKYRKLFDSLKCNH